MSQLLMWRGVLLCLLALACNNGARHPQSSPVFAEPAPLLLQDASFNWRWVAACLALDDTDGDGFIHLAVGRHGDLHGDRTVPFIFTRNGQSLELDEYLGSSPDKRFLAFIKRGQLWVLDAKTESRINLSRLFDASVLDDRIPTLAHPAVSFSNHGQAVLFARTGNRSRVLLVDLFTLDSRTLVSSDDFVWRAVFEDDDTVVRVLSLPSGSTHSLSVQTNLAGRACRGNAASWTSTGIQAEVVQQRVPLPAAQHPKSADEHVLRGSGCLADGRPILASSTDGSYLVAHSRTFLHAHHGPLQWVIPDQPPPTRCKPPP